MLGMAGIIDTLLQIILLIVVAGLVIIGGIGALLSRSRGGTLTGGFFRSIAVPPWPIGWLWVLWSTRAARRPREDWSTAEDRPIPWPEPADDGESAPDTGHVF
jgi:hypothetical protein